MVCGLVSSDDAIFSMQIPSQDFNIPVKKKGEMLLLWIPSNSTLVEVLTPRILFAQMLQF